MNFLTFSKLLFYMALTLEFLMINLASNGEEAPWKTCFNTSMVRPNLLVPVPESVMPSRMWVQAPSYNCLYYLIISTVPDMVCPGQTSTFPTMPSTVWEIMYWRNQSVWIRPVWGQSLDLFQEKIYPCRCELCCGGCLSGQRENLPELSVLG